MERGPDWSPFVVRDGNLITDQNPQSSHNVTTEIVNSLAE
ncbi:putative intracellular protease/amidase [Arthrobacter sp. CAN_A214]